MTTLTQDTLAPTDDNNLPPPVRTGNRFLRNLQIGFKLTLGFGALVILTIAVAAVSYFSSNAATQNIQVTNDVLVPTALVSAEARANLLRMLASTRGYLALGSQQFRLDYENNEADFRNQLATLKALSVNFSPDDQARLAELEAAFAEWEGLPDRLFSLRDDRLDREPGYRLLATDGTRFAGQALIGVQTLINSQGEREPTVDNIALLRDMANFQGSFAAMLSGLRGYATTQNRIFRQEYEANRVLNDLAWQQLIDKRPLLTANQRETLNQIALNRESFLLLPEEIFAILESDQVRQDLFLFSTKAIPLTNRMQEQLNALTLNQQSSLQTELNDGVDELGLANFQILIGGLVAMILGGVLAVIFRQNIAGPIQRLTGVAEQIRGGNLEAQASIESGDEIGTLAQTFNNMTQQLRLTLFQVRREKRRADDLLEVVIPIGIELASEQDFNRLLEKMLLEAKTFCHADAGILYLRTEDDRLKFVIVRNDTLGLAMGGTTGKEVTFTQIRSPLPLYHDDGQPNQSTIATTVAMTGETINIDNIQDSRFAESDRVFSARQYNAQSYLTIPLKDSQAKTLGVMQLINAQDTDHKTIIPFDTNLQQMMESFSSLAVAALEAYIREQGLRKEIQQLRIEIDESKRQQQVSDIVETDFFQELQNKARSIKRRSSKRSNTDDEQSAN